MRHPQLWLEVVEATRFGLKGPRAAEVLALAGVSVPAKPNTWASWHTQESDDSPHTIARLGNTEFFIEEAGDAPGIAALRARLTVEPGVYPVLREDVGLVLGGVRATQALAEVCNVNFAAFTPASNTAVMTLIAGISVLVLPRHGADGAVYRIWCDPSFGSYLWETLAAVVSSTTGRAA